MSYILGLTGPTGAGKSEFSHIAKKMGFTVIDCDKVAREAVEPNSNGLKALFNVFGCEILNPDGTLNRKKMAEIAFSTKENTELLNKTLLPHIVKLIESKIKGRAVLLDAPTLFESGINAKCNITVAVLSDTQNRLKRITARDNIDEKSALLRINAGKSDQYYLEKADKCFYNNGNLEEFLKLSENFLNNVLKGIDDNVTV